MNVPVTFGKKMVNSMSQNVPFRWNATAVFSSWILLAGFVLLPGTFASLKMIGVNVEAGREYYYFGQNTPLLCLATICCATGVAGIVYLWVRFRNNHAWLLDNLLG